MNENKLGTIPPKPDIRDAVHVAMISVRSSADKPINPGTRIRIKDGIGLVALYQFSDYDGVVDPFRLTPVQPNELFWLCLKPGSITSLVYHWQHPKFPNEKPVAQTDKGLSLAWLQDYVDRNCPYDGDLNRFLANVKDRVIYYHGTDCHNADDVENFNELCRHLSVVLDMDITPAYFENFSCSC